MAKQRLGALFIRQQHEAANPCVQIWEQGQVPDQYRDASYYSYAIFIPGSVKHSPMDVLVGDLIPWYGKVIARIEYDNGDKLLRVQ